MAKKRTRSKTGRDFTPLTPESNYLALIQSRERAFVASLVLAAIIRVWFYAAAFPIVNNVDEYAHVDTVTKYARGYWPNAPRETYDADTIRMFGMYSSWEYMTKPEDRKIKEPLWQHEVSIHKDVLDAWVESVGEGPNTEVHSPPVYYGIAAATYDFLQFLGAAPIKAIYGVRFLNAFFLGLTVWLSCVFCRENFPGRKELLFAVPMLVAFFPQDVFYGVNSDDISPPVGTLAFILLFRWRKAGEKSLSLCIGAGLTVAAAFLIKYTNIMVVITMGLLLILRLGSQPRSERVRDFARAAIPMLIAAAIPVAVCFARNKFYFGDFTATAGKIEILGWTRKPLLDMFQHPIFSPGGLMTFAWDLACSTWRGEYVWHTIRMSNAATDAFYALSTFIFGGVSCWKLFARWRRANPQNGPMGPVQNATMPEDSTILVLLVSVMASVLLFIWLSISFDFGPSRYPSPEYPYFTSGRLLMGALVPFLVVYTDGLSQLFGEKLRVKMTFDLVGISCLAITLAEFLIRMPAVSSQFNWFHLPF
jgi:hypothetical protein